jgi:hypothetical protein
MDVNIELPDLLAKLKGVAYSGFQLETIGEESFVKLMTHQGDIRFRITHPLSQDRQAEVNSLLAQYQS